MCVSIEQNYRKSAMLLLESAPFLASRACCFRWLALMSAGACMWITHRTALLHQTMKAPASNGESAVLHFLAPRHTSAVCNDGTSSGFYYLPAAGSSHWIVYLMDFGWCYDEESCRARCAAFPARCSSRDWARTLQEPWDLSKLLAGPDGKSSLASLENANRVYVPQCTSDAHMGNSSRFGMQFRGHAVITALFAALVQLGLGSQPHTTLIFGGGSAGGRGAIVHIDYTAGMLVQGGLSPDAAASIRVVGFFDAAVWLVPSWLDGRRFPNTTSGYDIHGPAGASVPSLTEQTKRAYQLFHATHLGAECAERFAADERWRCLFTEFRLPTLRTPYFVSSSQSDSFQLGVDFGHRGAPRDDAEAAAAASFAAATRSFGTSLVASPGHARAFFSWSYHIHQVTDHDAERGVTDGFRKRQAAGITMGQAFTSFLDGLVDGRSGLQQDGTPPEERAWIAECGSFDCSSVQDAEQKQNKSSS